MSGLKKIIETEKAPAAIGTYSQAVQVGQMLYVSGQIPMVPETGNLLVGDFEAQTTQSFDNLKAVIEAAGGYLADVVKMTVYLTDFSNFEAVNKVMERFFSKPYPAREVVEVKGLPKSAPIELSVIAHLS